jgi:hypothetical protein
MRWLNLFLAEDQSWFKVQAVPVFRFDWCVHLLPGYVYLRFKTTSEIELTKIRNPCLTSDLHKNLVFCTPNLSVTHMECFTNSCNFSNRSNCSSHAPDIKSLNNQWSGLWGDWKAHRLSPSCNLNLANLRCFLETIPNKLRAGSARNPLYYSYNHYHRLQSASSSYYFI